MKTGYIQQKAECSNLYCPSAIAYRRHEGGTLRSATAAMCKDANGNYWCQSSQCQQRYELIQWGAAHNWPAVTVGRYSILDEWECWKVAIMLGNQDAIERYYAALIRPVDDMDAIDTLLPDENEQEGLAS